MSADRVLKLIADARLHTEQAAKETEPLVIAGLLKDAAAFLHHADDVAAATHPRVAHPDHGAGTVVGVTDTGLLEVAFDGYDYAVAVHPAVVTS